MEKTLPANVRLVVYSYSDTNELIVKATRLNKKENDNYLVNSIIAGCRKFYVKLDIPKLSSMCKQSESKMVFDEELVDFV